MTASPLLPELLQPVAAAAAAAAASTPTVLAAMSVAGGTKRPAEQNGTASHTQVSSALTTAIGSLTAGGPHPLHPPAKLARLDPGLPVQQTTGSVSFTASRVAIPELASAAGSADPTPTAWAAAAGPVTAQQLPGVSNQLPGSSKPGTPPAGSATSAPGGAGAHPIPSRSITTAPPASRAITTPSPTSAPTTPGAPAATAAAPGAAGLRGGLTSGSGTGSSALPPASKPAASGAGSRAGTGSAGPGSKRQASSAGAEGGSDGTHGARTRAGAAGCGGGAASANGGPATAVPEGRRVDTKVSTPSDAAPGPGSGGEGAGGTFAARQPVSSLEHGVTVSREPPPVAPGPAVTTAVNIGPQPSRAGSGSLGKGGSGGAGRASGLGAGGLHGLAHGHLPPHHLPPHLAHQAALGPHGMAELLARAGHHGGGPHSAAAAFGGGGLSPLHAAAMMQNQGHLAAAMAHPLLHAMKGPGFQGMHGLGNPLLMSHPAFGHLSGVGGSFDLPMLNLMQGRQDPLYVHFMQQHLMQQRIAAAAAAAAVGGAGVGGDGTDGSSEGGRDGSPPQVRERERDWERERERERDREKGRDRDHIARRASRDGGDWEGGGRGSRPVPGGRSVVQRGNGSGHDTGLQHVGSRGSGRNGAVPRARGRRGSGGGGAAASRKRRGGRRRADDYEFSDEYGEAEDEDGAGEDDAGVHGEEEDEDEESGYGRGGRNRGTGRAVNGARGRQAPSARSPKRRSSMSGGGLMDLGSEDMEWEVDPIPEGADPLGELQAVVVRGERSQRALRMTTTPRLRRILKDLGITGLKEEEEEEEEDEDEEGEEEGEEADGERASGAKAARQKKPDGANSDDGRGSGRSGAPRAPAAGASRRSRKVKEEGDGAAGIKEEGGEAAPAAGKPPRPAPVKDEAALAAAALAGLVPSAGGRHVADAGAGGARATPTQPQAPVVTKSRRKTAPTRAAD